MRPVSEKMQEYNSMARELWGVNSFKDIGGKVKITDREHPYWAIVGVVTAQDVKISNILYDQILTLDRKLTFWAKKNQYKFL